MPYSKFLPYTCIYSILSVIIHLRSWCGGGPSCLNRKQIASCKHNAEPSKPTLHTTAYVLRTHTSSLKRGHHFPFDNKYSNCMYFLGKIILLNVYSQFVCLIFIIYNKSSNQLINKTKMCDISLYLNNPSFDDLQFSQLIR